MNKILIGSKAIKNIYSDYKPKGKNRLKDFDYATDDLYEGKISKTLIENGIKKEFIFIPALFKYDYSPELILTLKMSHTLWNISPLKHLLDVYYLQSKGLTFYPRSLADCSTLQFERNAVKHLPNYSYFVTKWERLTVQTMLSLIFSIRAAKVCARCG